MAEWTRVVAEDWELEYWRDRGRELVKVEQAERGRVRRYVTLPIRPLSPQEPRQKSLL